MSSFQFQEPWEAAEGSHLLLERLRAEIPEGHPLHAQLKQVLAHRVDSDDILVELLDGRFAMVHPTWCRRSRPALPFPHTVLFDDWDKFLQDVYLPERQQWAADNPISEWDEMLP